MTELFSTVYDKTLTEIGYIDGCSKLLRTYRYRNPSSFIMRVPATSSDVALMLTGFIIVFSDEPQVGYLIESVEPSAENKNVMEVSGRDIRALFGTRIVPRCQTVNGSLWNRIYWMIHYNAVNPTDTNRKLPYVQNLLLECSDRGATKTQQFTGDNVLDAIIDMLGTESFGWRCDLNASNRTITPVFMRGTDRTSTVLFDDIIGSLDNCEYLRDIADYKTVATIAGAGEGNDRVYTGIDITGTASGTISGFDRRELFVDARDMQRESQDADGSTVSVPLDEYKTILQQRGWEKLCANGIETKISVDVNQSVYQFGTDYFIGDVVSFCSHGQIGISGTARVVAAECDEYSTKLTMEILTTEVMQ